MGPQKEGIHPKIWAQTPLSGTDPISNPKTPPGDPKNGWIHPKTKLGDPKIQLGDPKTHLGDPKNEYGVRWDPKRRGFTPKSGLRPPYLGLIL